MEYRVKSVVYGYIEAESEEEALLNFDPTSDFDYSENIAAELFKEKR